MGHYGIDHTEWPTLLFVVPRPLSSITTVLISHTNTHADTHPGPQGHPGTYFVVSC